MDRAAFDAIPGWFDRTDTAMFSWFLSEQTRTGTSGDLAELGCYLGRSAALIGAFEQPDEIFTVIDLFGASAGEESNTRENSEQYADLSQQAFERHYLAVHQQLPVIVRGPSQDITEHARHGRHRFVHVDASHLYDQVRGDIGATRTLLAPDGIVVFDDIREAHTPGVWAAFWEAVITDGLRPIVVTEHKAYATWGDADTWQVRFLAAGPTGVECEEQHVLGRRLLRAWTTETLPSATRRRLVAVTPPALLHRLDRLRARRGT